MTERAGGYWANRPPSPAASMSKRRNWAKCPALGNCNIYEYRRRLFDAPARPPSCVARWESRLCCHSRKWESAVCGALVGTLSNKKQFPASYMYNNIIQ